MRTDTREESLLVSGMSIGEGLAVLVIMGILLALALNSYNAGLTHTAVTEVIDLAGAGRVAWVEQWATDGRLPVSNGALSAPAPLETLHTLSGLQNVPGGDLSRYVHEIDETAVDGQIVFQLRSSSPHSGPLVLQFRPAFGAGEVPATVLWLCGRAAVPRGFVRVGEDLTTLTNALLPSPCRGSK